MQILKYLFAPERTIEGKALDELSDLPQIIGGFDRESTILSIKFFSTYSRIFNKSKEASLLN